MTWPRPAVRYDEDCGHVIADNGAGDEHHEIPDDDAGHIPTAGCGCRPQRHTTPAGPVYVHVDQAEG